jgi:transposase
MEATGNGRPHGDIIIGGDREVVEQATRRTFTAKYKLTVLEQTEGMANGEIGAFLRREGLYSSNLSAWRKQRAEGALTGQQPRKRGRKELSADERLTRRVAQLEKEKAAVEEQLRKANKIVAVQKKVLSLFEELGLLSDGSNPS